MLEELSGISPDAHGRRRRWFQSSDLDLIVWCAEDGSISGFQLCYDRRRAERALTWIRGEGYSHLRVDDGESEPLAFKRAPILVADGQPDVAAIRARFAAQAAKLPAEVSELVEERLRAWPGGG